LEIPPSGGGKNPISPIQDYVVKPPVLFVQQLPQLFAFNSLDEILAMLGGQSSAITLCMCLRVILK
jgi:hypothetical protein